jgi:hypothetical protein
MSVQPCRTYICICVLIRECTASNTCVLSDTRRCNPPVASTILTVYPEYEPTHSTAATSTMRAESDGHSLEYEHMTV